MDPPQHLHNQNPAFFKKSVYEAILPLLRHEGYTGKEGARMAFAASALFQSENRVLEYLERWGKAGNQRLHDLVYMIKLPKDGNPNLKDWGDAVLKCGPAMARLVKFADKLPSPLKSSDGKTWSSANTRAKCATFAFNKAAEHPQLAALCFKHELDEEDFEEALEIVKKGPSKKKNLPAITLDGKAFDMEGGKFYQLPANDIRGLLLGEETDCCQSVNNHGHDCAEYGYRSKNGAFYVVENAKGKIIGQTFAWRGENNEMCFDTLETLGKNVTDQQWQKILKAAGDDLSKRADHKITRLTVGMGGGTPDALKKAFKSASSPATPKDYSGYRESKSQIVVWKRK
jgi:hypothetical protein